MGIVQSQRSNYVIVVPSNFCL